MTKSEKKKIIYDLLIKAKTENDETKLTEILTEVIKEVYSSGYTLKQTEFVSATLNVFVADFIKHYGDRQSKIETDEKFVEMSLQGIITLIDISLLADE